jgi:hypothetical protein
MPSLIQQLTEKYSGKKKEREDATAQSSRDFGDTYNAGQEEPPEEPGIEEEEFDIRGGGMQGQLEAGAPRDPKSLVSKLLAKGVPEAELKAAAQQIRMGHSGSAYIKDPAGGAPLSVGKYSPEGRELIEFSKSENLAAESAKNAERQLGQKPRGASKAPRVSGDAAALYEKTKVDPTRKNAVEYMRELREKNKPSK